MNKSTSNYADYTEKKFSRQCEVLLEEFSMGKDSRIVDFGAATGGLLYEFKKRGYTNIRGTDISYWAIEWGRRNLGLKEELEHYNRSLLEQPTDYLICLDVLEHVPSYKELEMILELAKRGLEACKGYFILRVPVADREGENFFFMVSRNDKTHVQCHCRKWWISLFERNGFSFWKDLDYPGVIWSSKGVMAGVFTC